MSYNVAVMGQPGAYHDQIAGHYFGEMYNPQYAGNFDEVFESTLEGQADFGVVAIENSSAGPIDRVHDLLKENAGQVEIVGEAYLRIRHSLLGVVGTSIEDIRQVSSHPMALKQCARFLTEYMVGCSLEEAKDTASAAKEVAENSDPSRAAIAGEENAQRYGLGVLKRNIEDDPTNQTRFLMLQKAGMEGRKNYATKTSLLVEANTNRQALSEIFLGAVSTMGIQVTRLQPHTAPGKPWAPDYFVDVNVGDDDPRFRNMQAALGKAGLDIIQLGSYLEGQLFS